MKVVVISRLQGFKVGQELFALRVNSDCLECQASDNPFDVTAKMHRVPFDAVRPAVIPERLPSAAKREGWCLYNEDGILQVIIRAGAWASLFRTCFALKPAIVQVRAYALGESLTP